MVSAHPKQFAARGELFQPVTIHLHPLTKPPPPQATDSPPSEQNLRVDPGGHSKVYKEHEVAISDTGLQRLKQQPVRRPLAQAKGCSELADRHPLPAQAMPQLLLLLAVALAPAAEVATIAAALLDGGPGLLDGQLPFKFTNSAQQLK